MHARLKRQILPMLRRQFAIKRARLWTARIVNINFGAGDEFSGPTCENRDRVKKLNRAFKRRIKTNRQIFLEIVIAIPFPLPLLFLLHAVDINGNRNPSPLCESPFSRAHQDSAFKLVKSTTRGGRNTLIHAETSPTAVVACRVESAMENRDRATVPDIKGCHSARRLS